MRSWSISVGRLFGVDVRIHLTFLVLPHLSIAPTTSSVSKTRTAPATSLWSASSWHVWVLTSLGICSRRGALDWLPKLSSCFH